MQFLSVSVLLLLLVAKSYNLNTTRPRKQLWEPGVNLFADRITESCVHMLDHEISFPVKERSLEGLVIPESFDARQQWPNCASIREIQDQGACGSCWAFGTVGAISDRTCIQSKEQLQFQYSADDLVTCCSNCNGCKGAPTLEVGYQYWVNHGIVSGGGYQSYQGCRPYEIGPIRPDDKETPACVKQCQRGYQRPYEKDLRFDERFDKIKNDVQAIQAEIMLEGPVTTGFLVYEDYRYNYTGKGVYYHKFGKQVSAHAVKLVGWGVENDERYWLVANSWGTEYGDGGFFKFLRGTNECNIESNVWSGTPKL